MQLVKMGVLLIETEKHAGLPLVKERDYEVTFSH